MWYLIVRRLYIDSAIRWGSEQGTFRKYNRRILRGVVLIDNISLRGRSEADFADAENINGNFWSKAVKWHDGIRRHAWDVPNLQNLKKHASKTGPPKICVGDMFYMRGDPIRKQRHLRLEGTLSNFLVCRIGLFGFDISCLEVVLCCVPDSTLS